MSQVTDLMTFAVVGGVIYYVVVVDPQLLTDIVDKIIPAKATPSSEGGGGGGGSPGDIATGFHSGCPKNANPGGNSLGWYTQGSNAAHLHHHCDWKQKCCFCTDVQKCIRSGVPPFRPGDCRPDWGTAGYLGGGGNYPKTADFSKCPAGTLP